MFRATHPQRGHLKVVFFADWDISYQTMKTIFGLHTSQQMGGLEKNHFLGRSRYFIPNQEKLHCKSSLGGVLGNTDLDISNQNMKKIKRGGEKHLLADLDISY